MIEQLMPAPSAETEAPVEPTQPEAEIPALEEGTEFPKGGQLLFRAIANGQIPGAYVAAGSTGGIDNPPPREAITGMGIEFFKPKVSTDVMAVLYNPKALNVKELTRLDETGKLTEVFPNAASIVGSPASASEDQTNPDGSVAPSVPEMPQQVPIQPRQAAGGDPMAAQRLAVLNSGGSPSKRVVPGGGAVLDGLMRRAV
jgi:hypothetical protein